MPEEKYAKIDRLGKYKILAEIGRGGMARVFKAEHAETGCVVAVKALLPELAGQPVFVKRFRREIETLRGLEHPRIVRILDVGSDGNVQYYVMEYMDGATVEKQFRLLGKFPVPEALRVARAVAEALEYAHGKGVIHRDIKPANIMTDAAGNVKLADFGIAKDIEATRLTVTGGIVGTADYMSPEQADGRRVTRKSDIYSLGVCLYQMVTGRLPFVGKTYMDVIRAHRFTLPESVRALNPSTPPRVSRLIEMMMEKDSEKRLASAHEVILLVDAIAETGRELTDEERESARDMIRWALVPERDWQSIVFRVAAGATIAVLMVVAAFGIKDRYFTSAGEKYLRGMREYRNGGYAKAKEYFERVVYFHPESEEAALAEEKIRACRRKLQELVGPASAARGTPDGSSHYEHAQKLLAEGKREEGIDELQFLANDMPDTQWGRKAAERLQELKAATPSVVRASSTESLVAGPDPQ